MKIKVEQSGQENLQQPLLDHQNNAPSDDHPDPAAGSGLQKEKQGGKKTPAQKAVRKTFKGTGHLARLLPTGSVLSFQIFSPILTHQGKCNTLTSRYMTLALLGICGFSCCLICFTDSLRDERGKVRYGLATFKGLWVIDDYKGSLKLNEEEKQKYRIKFLDFLHAFLSLLVFGTICLFDKNVVNCFFPTPTEEDKDLLLVVPIAVGVACSILFLIFPAKRHGISSPLSKE